MSSDNRMEDFKRRFRRSGSLGIPFVPEEDVKQVSSLSGIQRAYTFPSSSPQLETVLSGRKLRFARAMKKMESRCWPSLWSRAVSRKTSRRWLRISLIEHVSSIWRHVIVRMVVLPQWMSFWRLSSMNGGSKKQWTWWDWMGWMSTRSLLPSVRRISRNSTPSQEAMVWEHDQLKKLRSLDAITGSEWFPKSIYDLDICAKRVIMYGSGLDADHPVEPSIDKNTSESLGLQRHRVSWASDDVRRRCSPIQTVLTFQFFQREFVFSGEPIPRIEYTESERKTWGVIYKKLRELHKKYCLCPEKVNNQRDFRHACKQFLDNFELLERHCGYSQNNIPQLEDICKFLKGIYLAKPGMVGCFPAKTGFRVRPVAGYLSARDFLAGLAYRVFFCTQYVRHHADPFYTPEP